MTGRETRKWLRAYKLQSLVSVRSLDRLYAGVHLDSGQRVMVRQLLPGLPQSEQASTAAVIRDHATRLAALKDPHLLPVLEFTAPDEGPLYLVTDVPRGTSLGELVSYAGTLPTEFVAALGLAITKRLQYAHERGVTHLALHRDSVLIRPDGTVTVTDLGIAAMWVERLGEKLRRVHSAWDAVYPEPGCVAPEILAHEPLGPKTDIYGLGALLFTLSTTEVPFQGRSVVAFNSILSSLTPPDPRSVYSEVDEALAEIIVACLHRNPDDRVYPDMASLAEALKPLAGDWPQVVSDYRGALMDNSWLERFEPRLRVVDGGDAQSEQEPIPAPAVIPLFAEPASPLSEAELLSRMTNQQRAVYLAGERQRDMSTKSQLRRGALLGIILAFLVGAYFFPGLWDGDLTPTMQSTSTARPIWIASQSPQSLPSVRNRLPEQERRARGRYNIILYLQ